MRPFTGVGLVSDVHIYSTVSDIIHRHYKKKKKEALYMLDLCWIISGLLCMYSLICLGQLCRAMLGSTGIALRYIII
jgi:accessory gene regulator protein AgrB